MTALTLRQGHKMVEKINGRLATISINPSAVVNIWETDNAGEAYAAAVDKFDAEVERQLKLIEARADVRDAIRVANGVTVDSLVAQRKRLLDVIATLRHTTGMASERGISSAEALEKKIQVSREAAKGNTNSYSSIDEVTVSLLSPEQVKELDKRIQQLQLQIERIEDALTSANASGKITLSDNTIAVLVEEGLM